MVKKYFILAVCLNLLNSCLHKKQEKSKIRNVLSFHVNSRSSIAFSKDSAFVLHELMGSTNQTQYLYNTYYIQNTYSWKEVENEKSILLKFYKSVIIDSSSLSFLTSNLKRQKIFISDLSKLDLHYDMADTSANKNKSIEELECDKILRYKTGSYTYMICKGMARNLTMYSSSKKKETIFTLFESPRRVENFFIHNLVGDEREEIIVFLRSPFSRDTEAFDIEVYTIE